MRKTFFVILFALFVTEQVNAECDFEAARNVALSQALSVKTVLLDPIVVSYREYHHQRNGVLTVKNFKGYGRIEIPLWFLNVASCEVVPVLIERKIVNGLPILENKTPGVSVDIEEGPYGKIWNGYNTPYYVPDDTNLVALLNAWLPVGQTGQVYYTPFSFGLRKHFPTLTLLGRKHYQEDVKEALTDLRDRGTLSRAFPNMALAQVAERWFGNVLPYIPFIEQSDHRWFEDFEAGAEEFNPYYRVAQIIGANGNLAYNPTRSSAGAAGLMQIYPPTCARIIIKNYPDAGIPAGCGSLGDYPHSGHIEGVKSAIAHLDNTLKTFMDAERGSGFFGFITRNYMNLTRKSNFYFDRDLSQGKARGTDVKELQRILGVAADGIFGSRTRTALAEFQRKNFETMISALEGDPDFISDLGERQVAAYNSSVDARVIPATKNYLDKWDQVHLVRQSGTLRTPANSLVYETVMYLRIYRFLRDDHDVILR